MKRRASQTRLSALNLLEEAIHLLRTAPATAWLAYYCGTGPFVVALLYFWSDMSRGAFAERHLVGGALGLALLFVWMKAWQCVACDVMRRHVSREKAMTWSGSRLWQVVSRQLAIQPAGLFLLPVALFVLLPFGWLYAWYQNLTVLGAQSDEPMRQLLRKGWRQARFEPVENHFTLFLLLLFSMFIALNIALTILFAPQLLRILLGIESPVTMGVATIFNTTFLAVVFGMTFLCVDPLVKAVYVLRCFYGESRETGEDLRVDLRRLSGGVVVAVMLLCCPMGNAAETLQARAAVETQATDLNQSIDEVLRRPEYSWRAPRLKREVSKEGTDHTWLDTLREWAKDVLDSIGNWLKKIFSPSSRSSKSSPFSFFSGQGLAYSLIAIVAVVIGLLLYFLWRTRWKVTAEQVAAQPTVAPDLTDENVTAEQLPEDGWLRLAGEMIERGELRLALRALYLASLSHLAERNLVTLARFKSNRDYERELGRRSHALPEVSAVFSENVTTFDRAWYGLHEVTGEVLQQFRVNVERIRSC